MHHLTSFVGGLILGVATLFATTYLRDERYASFKTFCLSSMWAVLIVLLFAYGFHG